VSPGVPYPPTFERQPTVDKAQPPPVIRGYPQIQGVPFPPVVVVVVVVGGSLSPPTVGYTGPVTVVTVVVGHGTGVVDQWLGLTVSIGTVVDLTTSVVTGVSLGRTVEWSVT